MQRSVAVAVLLASVALIAVACGGSADPAGEVSDPPTPAPPVDTSDESGAGRESDAVPTPPPDPVVEDDASADNREDGERGPRSDEPDERSEAPGGRSRLGDDIQRTLDEQAEARLEPYYRGQTVYLSRIVLGCVSPPGGGFATAVFTPTYDAFERRGVGERGLLAWSPDGARLAVADDFGVWTVSADGFSIGRVYEESVFALAWAPDGERLAISTAEAVLVVDRQGAILSTVAEERARSVAWSDDGASVAYTVGRDGLAALRVWRDGETWQSPLDVHQFDWLPDGTLGVVSDAAEPIQVLRPFSADVVAIPYAVADASPPLAGTPSAVFVAFYEDGSRVAVDVDPSGTLEQIGFPPPTGDSATWVFDVASGELVARFDGVRLARPAPFSPDGSRVALVASAGSICEGGVTASVFVGSMDGTTREVDTGDVSIWTADRYRWSPDGETLARIDRSSPGIELFDGEAGARAGDVIATGIVRTGGPFRWSPDGSAIAFVEASVGFDCG